MVASMYVAVILFGLTAFAPYPLKSQEFSGCVRELGLSLRRISSLKVGTWDGIGSLAILDYDPFAALAAVVESRASNTSPLAMLIVNYANASAPVIHRRILVSTSAGEGDRVGAPNCVTTWKGYVALSLNGVPFTASGFLRIYHMGSGEKVADIALPGCSMPDSVTWSKDGRRMVIACEGEPTTQEITGSDPNVEPNPSGGIAIVSVSVISYTPINAIWPVVNFTLNYKLLPIQVYIDSLSDAVYGSMLLRGLRIDPRLSKARAAKDIEPEYVALDSDPNVLRAYITLQECNGVAVVDLTPGSERIQAIWPLGMKSWVTKRIDPSDKDGIRLRTVTGLFSWYQPDTIVHRIIDGRPYLFLANEGDSKQEARRVKDLLSLDGNVFRSTTAVRQDTELGRLNVDPLSGLRYGYNNGTTYSSQGPYSQLFAYGGRSWTILDANTGRMVFESGSHIETVMSAHPAASRCFNCDRDSNEFDSRSDNCGPEPEALEVFQMGNRTYAAIGLERMGGFLLYDVSLPATPIFGAYIYSRNFSAPSSAPSSALGDLAPETIKFVSARDNPIGSALLLLSNEVSATVSAWQLTQC